MPKVRKKDPRKSYFRLSALSTRIVSLAKEEPVRPVRDAKNDFRGFEVDSLDRPISRSSFVLARMRTNFGRYAVTSIYGIVPRDR